MKITWGDAENALKGVALASVLIYAAGFLVVHVHFEAYGVIDNDIVRARYLAAGFLYLLVIAVPTAVGVAFWGELASLKGGSLPARAATAAITSAVVGFFFFLMLKPLIYVKAKPIVTAVDLVAFFGMAGIACLLWKSARVGWPKTVAETNLNHVWRSLNWIMGVVGSMVFFGNFIYPSLRPGLGGGAAWIAQLAIDSTALKADVRRVLEQPVLVIERSNEFVHVLAGEEARLVSVPIGTVLVIDMLGTQRLVRQLNEPPRAAATRAMKAARLMLTTN